MGGWAERSPHQLKELCLVRMRAVMAATMSPATCARSHGRRCKIGHCVSLTNHRRLALSPSRSAAVEVLRLVDRVAVWASHLVAHRLGAGTETRDEDLAQGLARRADEPDARAARRFRHRPRQAPTLRGLRRPEHRRRRHARLILLEIFIFNFQGS